jgi:hypothetical protein
MRGVAFDRRRNAAVIAGQAWPRLTLMRFALSSSDETAMPTGSQAPPEQARLASHCPEMLRKGRRTASP